ncbi:LLM class flavin-dependent oxidoreductase [Capillimicrobium parvum]|uniref:F420-dependent glucose-6-phosphate dehydrogenase n=1 Tax=Capillimicrobium parvum TaxID=2884022 RepID=A0A9E6Y0A3_9ACTN|nr:LLM class flavin-dependent oxidoreductase [Capillimicrobium parvum]UGS37313.1 F420-dependent glucose-6-phosphate dehydrogenase [Capillimicrobium parvum]
MTRLEFWALFNGPYPEVPWAGHRRSNYIDLPQEEIYDDAVAQRVLEEQLESMVVAEEMGFDGVLLTEQHGGPIGLVGNALTAMMWAAARTSRIQLGAVGPIANAYLTPVRLAEEIALVDIMSKGRLVVGLPMGIGMQYHAYGVMNPAFARERWNEAHELLVKAMTEPGPFEWAGRHFHVPHVNLWPRPLQKPHPPIWIPAVGSRETLELVARHRYVYQCVLTGRATLLRNLELFRELCRAEGYEPEPQQVTMVNTVYVAETDAAARREAEPHVLWQYQNFFNSPFPDAFPPGHVSQASLAGMMRGGYRSSDPADATWEQLEREWGIVAGSPDTVVERLGEIAEATGAGRFLIDVNPGPMPRWQMLKNMSLLAEEVIPRLRGGRPVWADRPLPGAETWSERAERGRQPAVAPSARIDGELVDPRRAVAAGG